MRFNGKKLRKLRNERNPKLTLSALAQSINISPSTLSSIENGADPIQKNVKKICDFFNVNEFYFYFDDISVKQLFSPVFDDSIIDFISDPENLPYINMAIKLKEINVSDNLFESLITIIQKSREIQQKL